MNAKARKLSYVAITSLVVLLYICFQVLIMTGVISRYEQGILIFIFINIILAVSLNVVVGCLGQITLGHAGFMSIGAYAAALFTKAGIIPGIPGYIVGLLLGGVLAGLVGLLIGIPALRLKGDYLAIITLAFGEIIRALIEYFDFTGGAQGLNGIPRFQNFTLIYIIMIISVTLMFSVMTSRHGLMVLSIREDEIAAEATGVNTTYYKVFAFVLSAVFAGIAGGIYAHQMGIITARQFDYNHSINILVMVVLGGMGSFTGATISAAVLTILPELLRGFSDYRMIVYSLSLILMMLFRPTGLLGRKEFGITKYITKMLNNFEKKAKEKRRTSND